MAEGEHVLAKIDKKSASKALMKNTGIIAIGQISTRLVNFFLLPLYTALLTTEEYGTVDLLSTYSTLLCVLVGVQMSQAVFRFLVTKRNDEKEKTAIISTIVFATLGVFAVYTVVFLLISPLLSVPFKWYLLLEVISSITYQTVAGISRGLGDNASYALSSFISSTTVIVLNVLFIAVLRLGMAAMLAAYIIGPIIGTVVVLLRTNFRSCIRWSAKDIGLLKSIAAYCIPLVPNELSWSVIHSSDRWVISAAISVAANGLIAVASKFSVIYTTLFSIFNTSWTEQVVLHYKDEGGPEYINGMFEKMVTFFASIAIGIIACMPFVFGILVNEKYFEAYGLIPWYLVAVFFNAVIGLISPIYLVNNETKHVAVSTMVAAIINLVVDILLVKTIGVYAAPISSICGYLTISIWRLIDVNKRHCRILLSLSTTILLIVMLAVSMAAFYSGEILFQIAALAFVAISALALNKSVIVEIIGNMERGKTST